jgi:hypothetical protein
MKIRLIRVSEIREFITAEFTHFHTQLPVTPERAESQARNPNALSDDPCLLLALGEENVLLGYLGVLPVGKTPVGTRIFGTSCWWIDPVRGRGAAMPLFYRMMELTDGNLMFFDLTLQTSTLLGNLGMFSLYPEKEGVYGWFRSGFARRYGRGTGFKIAGYYALAGLDSLINLLPEARIQMWSRRLKKENLQTIIQQISRPDEEVHLFLQKLARENFMIREKSEIEWILSWPWIKTGRNTGRQAANYAFSWHADTFETSCLKVSNSSGIIGFAMITNRNGICKVPLMYAHPEQEKNVAGAIIQSILSSQAHGIICWNSHLLDLINTSGFPFIRKRKPIRRRAVSSRIRNEIPQNWEPQDGDGDGIFT